MVNTGDNLAHVDALPPLLDALGPLLDVPGVFVLGSNDYFAPILRNPLWYLLPDDGTRVISHDQAAVAGARRRLLRSRLARPDQPPDHAHGRRPDRRLGGRRRPAPDATTTSTPWSGPGRRRRRPAARRRARAVPAGARPVRRRRLRRDLRRPHPRRSGRLPLWGALVTNCDLEPARAKGLHRHPADSRPGDAGSSWLHVSAGLGTSPYAPIRVACRPEATLLTLTRRPDPRAASTGDSERPDPLGYARRCLSPGIGRRSLGAGNRAVAQFGSAPRSGRGGRRFKSCQPDHFPCGG